MSAVGPFEVKPTLAVGVSGGPDSLCLALLLKTWVREVGGELVGLIVDHRLRPESAAEAAKVQGWLMKYGVRAHTLVWENETLGTGEQARARTARYNLLLDWCKAAHILHLALGHHRDDQAETLLMRQRRSSGKYGLAGMPSIREQGSVRLIRPFLAIPAPRLRATLQGLDQDWVSDPSNCNPKYTRTQIRKSLAEDSTHVRTQELSKLAAGYAKVRNEMEQKVSRLLAKSVKIHSEGFCLLDVELVMSQSKELALKALSNIIWSLGGAPYPPRQARVNRLFERLNEQGALSGYTLGGCLFRSLRESLVVCREPIAARESLKLKAGVKTLWDSRFMVELKTEPTGGIMEYQVRALSADGWGIYRRNNSCGRGSPFLMPFFVAYGLPSLWSLDGLVSAPHLDYKPCTKDGNGAVSFVAYYRPRRPLVGPLFRDIGCHVTSKTIK